MWDQQRHIVTAGDDFELQCTVRNTGLIPLVTANRVSVSLNRIKMRRGHHMQTIKLLNPSEETTLVWQIRSFSPSNGNINFRFT